MAEVRTVTPDEMFEILCADCLRQEPFPGEIKVIGQALNWSSRIKTMAARRGLKIDIKIEQREA